MIRPVRQQAAIPGGDLSILTLFLQADIIVKIVMVLLVLASVWVWAVIFEKIASIRRANRQADVVRGPVLVGRQPGRVV